MDSYRMSQQFRNQGQGNGGKVNKQQQPDPDAFMRLPSHEIAGCISDIGVPFSHEDLQKPNPQQIQKVFEWFAQLLMNATRDTVEPAMRAAVEDVCGGEYLECVPADTRNLMGFYVCLRRLLVECGITDFSFNDLLKPTNDRLIKIFSYIINFVRFRESQTEIIDENFNKTETTKAKIETLYMDNQDMDARLDEMRRERKSMDQQVKEKTKRNDDLKQRLLELKRSQERVAERLERVRTEKQRLTSTLETRTEGCLSLRQDSSKLRPYVLESPSTLQANLTNLSTTLTTTRGTIDSLDRRTRALQTSTDTFDLLTTSTTACTKLLDEISLELSKEEEENVKAAKRRDALSERGNNVREVERTEAVLQRHLKRWVERTESVRKGSREKSEEARRRMEVLRGVHRGLSDERAEKGREMEMRRVRIEQVEKKMADLKENIEEEIHSAHDQYLKMDSHVNLYMNEIEHVM